MSGSSYPPRGRDLEAQNDDHLEGLHAKIKALHNVTSDIRNDANQQNSLLDATTNTFEYFKSGLTSSASQLSRTVAANKSPTRLALTLVAIVLGLYIFYRLFYA